MDFRTVQSNGNRPVAPAPATPVHKEERTIVRGPGKASNSRLVRLLTVILLAGIVVLLVGVIFAFSRGASDNESKFINKSDYQAVFLNNGQVYFGNIQDLNNDYVRMTNIYYLTQGSSSSSSSSSSNDYSLVKLGCQQIHDPLDEMVVNRSQVTFWENLNANGKVVTSIKEFQQQNPNGPNCSEVSSQTQASSNSSSTQGNTGTSSSNSGTSSSSK
ncbi:MAG TPA: hypothetical protein VMB52_02145 [Verrucomicrobiae bacterium]|nr:hypothetical protein [Verrucomicrobiae bacterium]